MTDDSGKHLTPGQIADAMPPAGASPEDDTPPRGPPAYDRDLLRAQIDILRRASAERAKLEVEIRDEHDKETAAARNEAKKGIEATRAKYEREIEAARREYAAVLERLDAQAAAEGTKLDQQRDTLSAQIGRNASRHEAKLQEDDQFDEGQEREVYKEKRRDPVRLCDRSEKKLAKDSSEVDEAETRCLRFLAACGVKPPSPAAEPGAPAPDGDAPLPDGPDVLKVVETLSKAIADRTGSLGTLKSVRRAFAGGTQAAAIGLPLLGGIAAGAAAFFLLPPSGPAVDVGARAIPAAAAAGGVSVIGLGAGLWLLARLRRAARAEAVALKADIDGDVSRFRRAAIAAGTFLHRRRDEQIAQVDTRYKSETEARKTRLASRLAEIAGKRDASLAELEAKYRSAVETIARKRDGGREAAERKYPPRIQALTTSCAEDVAALEHRRDSRLSASPPP
ncbi:MAG: hypothetical protein EBZ59_00990, partial [Planctomycetia bacterium]|nr:hypothetical protein [Planctomycetia bacterium]